LQKGAAKKKDRETDLELVARYAELGLFHPNVRFAECPIRATLGVLGKKWTMLILRDVGLRKIDRFNRLLESVPGLTPRVLSMRLKELEEAGYIKRTENNESPTVRWSLTEKGVDALPILFSLIAFGSKWHPEDVFEDKKQRKLEELFEPEALRIIGRFA
jgi:DNA-binding HxlR family transcriptional regulator